MKTLWLPESARVPKFTCMNCGTAEFSSELRYVRHVGRCVKTNTPEPPERSAFDSYSDSEQVAWVKDRAKDGKPLKGIIGGDRPTINRRSETPRRGR